MVKHIVMWRLHEQCEGRNKADNARLIKERLESLNDRIPGLLRLEVGIDFLHGAQSADIVLYSEFTDRAALEAYQVHPEHQAVVPLVRAAASERRVVDYDC